MNLTQELDRITRRLEAPDAKLEEVRAAALALGTCVRAVSAEMELLQRELAAVGEVFNQHVCKVVIVPRPRSLGTQINALRATGSRSRSQV